MCGPGEMLNLFRAFMLPQMNGAGNDFEKVCEFAIAL